MTISFWLDAQTEKEKEEYDIVIVGAGIAGASAAYWLSQKKDLKLGIFDSGITCGGASGRNGGFILRGVMSYYNKLVQAHGRDIASSLLQLNHQTQQYIEEFAQKFGNSFALEKCGSYLLAASLDELQDLSESAELMKEDGFDLEYLKSDPIDRGFYGAIENPGDLGVNPYQLVKALLEASGLAVHENEQVFQIGWKNHQALLRTQKRLISAGRVLLCTNAYLPLLVNEMSGMGKPVRGQILVTRPIEERVLDKLCYANYGQEYFRQLPDGRFLLGGCREPFIDEEENFADTVTANVQGSLQNYLKDRFPEVAGANIDYRWSGTMYFTQDGLPLIGEVPDKPGVVYLAGCNGHGMGYSLALSKLLVEYALDGAKPGIFDSRRLQLAVNK
jgi:gamma-glutamylputrescine oxidase